VGLLKLVPAEFVSVSTVLMNYENTDKAMMLRSLSVLHKLSLITLDFDLD